MRQEGTERRECQRMERRLPAACRPLSAGPAFAAESRDISGKGIRLATEEPVPVGAVMAIGLDVQDRYAPIQLEGTVVWRDSGQLGVRFSRINYRDLRFFRLCFPDKNPRQPA